MMYSIFYIDINECVQQTHTCDINATCQDTEGSFLCSCNVGFAGNGNNCSGKLANSMHLKVIVI